MKKVAFGIIAAVLLSGCVAVPGGIYIEPAPVVVAPWPYVWVGPGYYGGLYYGVHPHHYGGYYGHGYRRWRR